MRVSRRVLWLRDDAYPLQNIARAKTVEIPTRRTGETLKFLAGGVGMTLFGIILIAILDALPSWGLVTFLGYAVRICGIIFYLLLAFALYEILTRKLLYALVIETSGNPATLVASEDRAVVDDLVVKIMDAIDDPGAEFQVSVENFHVGDRIQQIGNGNTGVRR
ncbi:DUF6232 family protein [Streptomyces sp. NPDC057367]|uniref:DUF6232 family protein n=1 Tax=Streptomyces sp. NPDC057367 TaxID=3346108 RepID=UPI00362EFF2E